MSDWLHISRGEMPLIVSIPHAGTRIPPEIADDFVSPALAQGDADLHVERLYAFAADMGATVIRTDISRSAIDMNRDPSGASLYPGQATTELCPTTSFDGTALYASGRQPGAEEIARRRARWFAPYHHAISDEIARLRALHPHIVLYDAHSIRSHVPRLFAGELPQFNIGTNGGTSCAALLTSAVEAACDASGLGRVTNGRFRGGWITRHYGAPDTGVHAIQMELAMRGYLDEASPFPAPWDPARAAPLQTILQAALAACLIFAKDHP